LCAWLAKETLLGEGEVLLVAVKNGRFLTLQGSNLIPLVATRDGRHFKPEQCIRVKCSVLQGKELQKLKEILSSNHVIGKEMILTQGWELLLNAFRLFDVSIRHRIAHIITIITIIIMASNIQIFS
jgi:hypothetical protein